MISGSPRKKSVRGGQRPKGEEDRAAQRAGDGDQHAQDENRRAAYEEQPDVEPESCEDLGERLTRVLRVEERLLGARPSIGRGDVEGGRQIDHDGVDLAVLQRGLGLVVLRECGGLLGRLHHVVDVVEAGGADLGAQLHALEVRDALRLGGLGALQRDDGLTHVVVAGGEVHGLLALGADRHLVDVEVEGLLTGREGLVEGDGLPDDGALVVAELLRHGVRDRRLEALAIGGLVVLEPRLVRGLVRRDRQLAGGLGAQLALGAGLPGSPGGLVTCLVLRLRSTAHGEGEQGDGGGRGAAQGALGEMHGGRLVVHTLFVEVTRAHVRIVGTRVAVP